MGIYKTHKEAVIANGSVKGIFTDGKWFYTDGTDLKYCNIKPCNPADYLETLESFLVSGKRLVVGDKIVSINGLVISVKQYSKHTLNTPKSSDIERFILQATADQAETPEEKEVFDSIDTTLQQVEPLAKAEWKNGDKVSSDGMMGVFVGIHPDNNELCYVMEDGIDNPVLWHTNRLSKPETPAEREKRERLEAAYDLYCEFTRINAPASTPKTFERWKSMLSVEAWLAVADKKADYRKQ